MNNCCDDDEDAEEDLLILGETGMAGDIGKGGTGGTGRERERILVLFGQLSWKTGRTGVSQAGKGDSIVSRNGVRIRSRRKTREVGPTRGRNSQVGQDCDPDGAIRRARRRCYMSSSGTAESVTGRILSSVSFDRNRSESGHKCAFCLRVI